MIPCGWKKMVNQARVYKIFPLLSVCFHGNGSSFEFVFLLHHTSTCWSFDTMWLISLDFFNGNILQISSFSTLLGSFFFVSPACKESWIGADAVAIAHGIFSRSIFFFHRNKQRIGNLLLFYPLLSLKVMLVKGTVRGKIFWNRIE